MGTLWIMLTIVGCIVVMVGYARVAGRQLPKAPEVKQIAATPHAPKYDAHYTRKLELEEYGYCVTVCRDDLCPECYPEAAAARTARLKAKDAELAANKRKAIEAKEAEKEKSMQLYRERQHARIADYITDDRIDVHSVLDNVFYRWQENVDLQKIRSYNVALDKTYNEIKAEQDAFMRGVNELRNRMLTQASVPDVIITHRKPGYKLDWELCSDTYDNHEDEW